MSLRQYTGPALAGFAFSPNFTMAHILRRYSPQKIPTASTFALGTLVQPFTVDWALANDDWGIPFTAGRVGVIDRIGVAGGGDYETQIDAYIAANTTPVPGTLPVGYTARLEHDCDGLLGSDMGMATCDSTAANYTRYMGPDGPIAETWVPYNAAQARGYQTVKFSSSFTLIDWDSTVTPTIGWFKGTLENSARGWRNISLIWQCVHISTAPPHNLSGSIDLYISHNADGSTVANGDHFGDTIDYSTSFDKDDLFYVSDGGALGHYEIPEITIGALNPSFGVPTNYRITFKITETEGTLAPGVYGSNIADVTWVSKMSPTDDIPFRWTCCGDDDLIAPGGLVS